MVLSLQLFPQTTLSFLRRLSLLHLLFILFKRVCKFRIQPRNLLILQSYRLSQLRIIEFKLFLLLQFSFLHPIKCFLRILVLSLLAVNALQLHLLIKFLRLSFVLIHQLLHGLNLLSFFIHLLLQIIILGDQILVQLGKGPFQIVGLGLFQVEFILVEETLDQVFDGIYAVLCDQVRNV